MYEYVGRCVSSQIEQKTFVFFHYMDVVKRGFMKSYIY